ncbi:MAG TPA: zinc-dependent metalloprotease [Candidatus Limnocylindrales bacterium]|nr:zinc-dependent metalloprotease [Candidatus Limnocylindrales bacterium]
MTMLTGTLTLARVARGRGGATQGAPMQSAAPQGRGGADANAPLPTIAAKIAGMQKFDGYFPFYWDARGGKVWLAIDKWDLEFLYTESLPAGLGSNDVGLDRGQGGRAHVVKFTRSGPRVLLVASNYGFRANTNDPDQRRGVEESFAVSALWGFDVAAEDTGGAVLVDATNFFLRDSHSVIATLKRTQQGTFRLDATRSAFYLPGTKNFPKNTEVEVTLTFTGDEPGNYVRQVTPDPTAITVREHQSLIELPGPGFKPRVYDPRSSFFGISYMDFAAPVSESVEKRFIARHRLEKKDPNAAMSEPVQPIVYYLDRGAPEPIRSALLEGANWWAQAFEAAGFKNAFRVELMPEGMDPMDIRYNVIQWVHRATRGWSYGGSVTDPRTGEIIKGQVTLGSLRARQDYLIAEGLTAPYEKGKAVSPALMNMVLARMRQLAAHEVGHTLGLAHNYSASTVNRASVMDYPPPDISLDANGVPDLSNAYATGIGAWDKVSITFGYSQFAPGTDEAVALNKIMNDAYSSGQRYLTDQDARPASAASPYAHLWDTGSDAVSELDRIMKVRAAALKRFGENNIREGAPMATLEDVLAPIYMMHRYQVEAAAKVLGSVDYSFALRGDALTPNKPVPPAEQRKALEAVLATLTPAALAVPESLLKMIPPRPPDYPQSRELFRRRTAPVFDSLAPAEAIATHTVAFLFDPERAERLVEFNALDAQAPGFGEVVDRILALTWQAPHAAGYAGQIQNVVNQVVLYDMMTLAADQNAGSQARAIATFKLNELKKWLDGQASTGGDGDWRAACFYSAEQIGRFQKDPKQFDLTRPTVPPDGMPIGMDDDWDWDGN